jgi:Outer membrane protein beta-barrel domain
MKCIALASGLALVLLMGPMQAQENHGFTFDMGAGFTNPLGTGGRSLDNGWNIQAGAGYNFIPHVGAMLDFGFNNMGVNSATLGNLGYSGGTLRVFSATVDPIFHLNPHGHVDVYVTGGGGFYHEWQTFTNPGIATGFNPFFGFFNYGVNVVAASSSVNKPGVNIGAGVQIGTKWHGKFFAEARYHRIYTNPIPTDYIPVTFGFRW